MVPYPGGTPCTMNAEVRLVAAFVVQVLALLFAGCEGWKQGVPGGGGTQSPVVLVNTLTP